MKVILKELHLNNFRSWNKLDLVDLDSKRLCLIQGENGSGKSSIRHAIEYLLLDDTAESLPLEELPFNNSKDCMISGKLQRDNDEIEIIKYRNHRKYKNNIVLKINGDDSLTKTDRRDTQREINKLFNTENLLLSTSFSQFSPSFAEAKEAERKDILYPYLDLERFNSYQSKAKDKTKEIKSNIDKNELKVENLKETIESLKLEIAELKLKKDDFKKEKRQKVVELLKQQEELNTIDSEELETKLKKLNKELEQISKSISVNEKDLKHKNDMIYDTKLEINNKESEHKQLKQQMDKIKDNICPILKEECSRLDEEKDKIEKETEPKLLKIESELETLSKTKKEQDIDKVKLEERNRDNREKESNYNSKIRSIELELSEIEHYNKSIETKKKDIEDKIEEISKEENPYDSLLDKNNKQIKDRELEVKTKEKDILKLKDEYKYYEFWITGYSKSGIPNLIVEKFLSLLENNINNYLFNISDTRVQLAAQSQTKSGNAREKIGFNILTNGRSITNYISYSGGERHRIKAATLFGFNNLMSNFNFLFLDEVLELSLDKKGNMQMIDTLINKAGEGYTLFVISHQEDIKNKFSDVLTVEKKDDISYLTNR